MLNENRIVNAKTKQNHKKNDTGILSFSFTDCINVAEFLNSEGKQCVYTYTNRKYACKKDVSNDLCCTEILAGDLVYLDSYLIILWFTEMSIPVTDLQSTSPYEYTVTS